MLSATHKKNTSVKSYTVQRVVGGIDTRPGLRGGKDPPLEGPVATNLELETGPELTAGIRVSVGGVLPGAVLGLRGRGL